MALPTTIPTTYGPWFISLLLELGLFGIGTFQTWCYYYCSLGDGIDIKIWVFIVMFFETLQVAFFSMSSYVRFVERFGTVQEDLLWSDSLQLLANYLSAFVVQMYFASSVYYLTRQRHRLYNASTPVFIAIAMLSVISVGAGIAQTVVSYRLRSFAKLADTKVITTLQTAGSLGCNLAITLYLCFYFQKHKNELRPHRLINMLMINAVVRGVPASVCSVLTMSLFLVAPGTFYFFLGLAPSSKIYMNSMLLTLNMREAMRSKVDSHMYNSNIGPISEIEFVPPPDSTTASDDITRDKAASR
ncbi:hypothetical protein FB45DRAFT_1023084 [Roridomyces roridus]|uniref:DUF6534 domain-containing protein n=1 Tax=Roridomyces roridus TaxID=1738132 RepID=A0AAD7C3P4_9AGAR|nr:hypothetical protein FB45DRAFT_1023084 [Roridomyces roridus]